MLAASVYKNIHLLGVFMVLMALGGVILHHILGGARASCLAQACRHHARHRACARAPGGLWHVGSPWYPLAMAWLGARQARYLGGLWRLERCRGPQYDIGTTPVVGQHYSGRVGRLSRHP